MTYPVTDPIACPRCHLRTATRFVLSKSVASGVAGASQHPTLVVPITATPERFLSDVATSATT